MTREEAIAVIKTLCHTCKYFPTCVNDKTECFKAINMAIQALEEPHWISCSERLPEEYGEYRITWTTSASKKRFIGDSEYEITGEWDSENDRFNGEWLLDDYIKNYPDVKVLAWKPLEEPWGGDAE